MVLKVNLFNVSNQSIECHKTFAWFSGCTNECFAAKCYFSYTRAKTNRKSTNTVSVSIRRMLTANLTRSAHFWQIRDLSIITFKNYT